MTKDELIASFEQKVKRYVNDRDQAELMRVIAPISEDYYNVAINLEAEMLLEMIQAYRERPALLDRVEALKDQLESARHEAAAVGALHERAEAELAGLRTQVLDMAARIEVAIAEHTAMEGAGCHALAALRSVGLNAALTDSQRGLVREARAMMLAVKPQWLSLPPVEQAELLARGRAVIAEHACAWRPIDTAPQDGTEIIVLTEAGRPLRAQWLNYIVHDETGDDGPAWVAVEEGQHPPCWTDGVCWTVNEDGVCSDQPKWWIEAVEKGGAA